VSALAVSDTNLYVGGYFTTAGGYSITNLAEWNGSSWSPLGSGFTSSSILGIQSLAVSDGNLYVGGSFTMAGGQPANLIAKWDGGSWSGLGSGLDASPFALAVSRGDLYVGGDFTTAGGKVSPNVAKAVIVSPANLVSSFFDGGNFVVKFDGTPGITYTVESTPSILPANWQKATNIMAPNANQVLGAGMFEFRDPMVPSGQRFYRTVYPAY
jgi:hypothetical protein